MRLHAIKIRVLGRARYPSPVQRQVHEGEHIPDSIVHRARSQRKGGPMFELAGPRAKLFFDPRKTRAGIVTCGGLCPGLNDVIRSLFFELHDAYAVKEVLGFRWGYQGLDPVRGGKPVVLTHSIVDGIHQKAGTILGTSRGPVDIGEIGRAHV